MVSRSSQDAIPAAGWDPKLYLKFADYRLRPALELLQRIPLRSPGSIHDLGCGTGQVTRLMAERWPAATVYGLDSSKEMLAQAAAKPSGVQWLETDVRTWSPEESPDLIFSNAMLHWVEGHHDLFPQLMGLLKPGGCLAVQMPLSWSAPSHRLMRETLADGGTEGKSLGTEALRQSVARKWVEDPEFYYDILAGWSSNLDIWETEYLQPLEGDDPVLEWVKGTGLRPILNGLDDEEREIFLAEYTRRLREAYPTRFGGRTLYPFRRLFIVAIRSSTPPPRP
jgi:trans-aconitate 2-methyltransferase